MKVFVGLGNPGREYKNNRHNVGALLIDYMQDNYMFPKFANKFNAEISVANNLLIAKPTTFMNNSGACVVKIMNFYNIAAGDICVIHDDIELKFGDVRHKEGGGHGGHNGLRSITASIGPDYKRIRIGVGRPNNDDVAGYVLSDFDKIELSQVYDLIKKIAEEILS